MLELEMHQTRKLQLTDILEITEQSMNDQMPQTQGGLPWHLLRKVMGLHGMARSVSLGNGKSASIQTSVDGDDLVISDDLFSLVEMDRNDSSHLLDVLCAVLHSPDSFLQQELISKIVVGRFALPLLLPPLDTYQTLLLWAMRGTVKRWSLHPLPEGRGFKEESWVHMSMPTISFMRIGHCSFSKSNLLKTVLSPSHDQGGTAKKTLEECFLKEFAPALSLTKARLFIKTSSTNEARFDKGLQSWWAMIVKNVKTERKLTTEITSGRAHMGKDKQETLQLQGELSKNLARVEKELCWMRKLGDIATADYKSQLTEKIQNLWNNLKFLTRLDKDILESSLDMEHFTWELGQFYEAECSMAQEREMSKDQRQLVQLPDRAAELELEGFFMELVDGEASNIPLQWVADVLAQLHTKLGGKSRVVVLAVLWMQSTRKSTLLNPIFGLQFPL
ncbi:LOW QUALITY PROTEIN: up-regulator of cell proliferation-like [Morphnus guianensis]